MELRHLRYFIAVAEELHFGRAAARLHISQQPLSAQIKDLESELGTTLFQRCENRVRLTAAGAAFLDGARQTVASANAAVDAARGGKLRLGFCSSAVHDFLPGLLYRFRALFPAVTVELIETYNQWRLLAACELDLVFVHLVKPPPSFRIVSFRRERFVVAVGAGHPLAQFQSITLDQLLEFELVTLPLETVPALSLFLDSWPRRPRFSQEVQDKLTLLSLVRAGLGIAVVPAHVRDAIAPAGLSFLDLKTDGATLDLGYSWRPNDRNPALLRFLEALER